jgi:hypothetical protein
MFVETVKRTLKWVVGLLSIVAAAAWALRKYLPVAKTAPSEMPKVSKETLEQVADAHAKADAIKIEAAAEVAVVTETVADIAKDRDGRKRRQRLADLEKNGG